MKNFPENNLNYGDGYHHPQYQDQKQIFTGPKKGEYFRSGFLQRILLCSYLSPTVPLFSRINAQNSTKFLVLWKGFSIPIAPSR